MTNRTPLRRESLWRRQIRSQWAQTKQQRSWLSMTLRARSRLHCPAARPGIAQLRASSESLNAFASVAGVSTLLSQLPAGAALADVCIGMQDRYVDIAGDILGFAGVGPVLQGRLQPAAAFFERSGPMVPTALGMPGMTWQAPHPPFWNAATTDGSSAGAATAGAVVATAGGGVGLTFDVGVARLHAASSRVSTRASTSRETPYFMVTLPPP